MHAEDKTEMEEITLKLTTLLAETAERTVKNEKKIEELQKVEAEKKLTLFNLEELNRFYQDEEDFRNYFEKLSEDDEGKNPVQYVEFHQGKVTRKVSVSSAVDS